MTSSADKPLSVWAFIGLTLALATLAAMMLAGLGYRWGWWHFRLGFWILRYSLYGAATAAGASLLGLALSLWERSWQRAVWSAVGLALGAVLIAIPLNLYFTAQSVPRIHDITTDTEDPPRFVAILPLREGAPNPAAYEGPRVAQLQKARYPDIRPTVFAKPPNQIFKAALAAARDMGWTIAATVPNEGRIEATARTFWFGFRDDVVIRIRSEGQGARLDIRSKSRIGRSDVGANAKRIRAFLERMKKSA